jgi:hypothetical protein
LVERCSVGAAVAAAAEQAAWCAESCRRVISGIWVALQSSRRWIKIPVEYGPCKTLYSRFVL